MVYVCICVSPLYVVSRVLCIIMLIVSVVHVTVHTPAIPFSKHVCSARVGRCVYMCLYVNGPNSQAN